ARLRAGADRDETIHFGAEIDVRLFLRPDRRVEHRARIGIDLHRLPDVERARDILVGDAAALERVDEILPAAVVGNFFRTLTIQIDASGELPLRETFRNHLEALSAAHPLLQIVPT